MDAPRKLAVATLRLAIVAVHRALANKLGPDPQSWAPNLIRRTKDDGAREELQRQFDSATARLAKGLEKIHAQWPEEIGSHSYHQTLEMLAIELERLTGVVDARRQLANATISDVVDLLSADVEMHWDRTDLDHAVRLIGKAAITVCGQVLLAWVTAIPAVASDDSWTALAETVRLVESTRGALEAVRMEGLLASGPYRIAAIQRRDLLHALKYMQLFGLPFEARYRTVPISVSHLEGRFAGNRYATAASLEKLLASPDPRSPEPAISGTARGRPPSWVPGSRRSGFRLIITGRAGFGKTTAIQWIAYRAALRKLSIYTEGNKQLLPLFVHLRDTAVSRRPPADRDLLYAKQTRIEADLDPDWLSKCRSDFTPLVLLDGWDEISQLGTEGATAWVESLATRFPEAHIIITSRPEGMPAPDLLKKLRFEELRIQPLRPPDAVALVRRWFKGIARQLEGAEDLTRSEIDRAEQALLHDLESPTISDMADTPLLTAMLCCLYVTPTYRAPERKTWMYTQVVSALLHGREWQRGITSTCWAKLEEGQKETVLGAIAQAMARVRSQSIAITAADSPDELTIEGIVGEVLPIVGRAKENTTEWTKAILDRSILLQRVSRNKAEFVHQSIQDYLAARAIRADHDITTLLNLANSGQWTLLPFACYKADKVVADKIVSWLLDKLGRTDPAADRPLRLLVVECVGATTSLSTEVRDDADRAVRTLFPPRDLDEAKTLAALGNAAVPYLTSTRTEGLEARRSAIRTLCRIGTPAAMDALTEYARTGVSAEAAALGEAIEWFDPDRYAEHVMSRFGSGFNVTARSDAVLAALRLAGRVNSLRIEGIPLTPGSVHDIRQVPELRQLTLSGCPHVGPLDWTAEIGSLRSVSICDSTNLVGPTTGHSTLTPRQRRDIIGPPRLWSLHMSKVAVGSLNWTTVLGDKADLRVLSLTDISGEESLIPESAVSVLRNLTSVALSGHIRFESLAFLRTNTKLSTLRLSYPLSPQDLIDVSQCSRLHTAELRFPGNAQLHQEGRARPDDRRSPYLDDLEDTLADVRHLRLTAPPPELVAIIGRLHRLQSLELNDARLEFSGTVEIPDSLTDFTFRNCSVGAQQGPAWSTSRLRRVSWSGGTIRDLTVIPESPLLRELTIVDSHSLTSLSGLSWVPRHCAVYLAGVRADLDPTPIKALGHRCALTFDNENVSDSYFHGHYIDLGGS